MPKNLNDVLKGVKKSTINKLTTGENPGVDYADKSKDTRDFFDQHPVQKHEDRVGNGDDVYKASNVKKAFMLRHGHEPKPKDIRVYDKTNQVTEAKDPKEYGYEGDMAITQLKTICRHAEHLMKMLKPDADLPEWVQAKITKAEDYISTAHDYLMSEMKEETELSENEKPERSKHSWPVRRNKKGGWFWANSFKGGFSNSKEADEHAVKTMIKNKNTKVKVSDLAPLPDYNAHLDGVRLRKLTKEEVEEFSEAKCNMSEAGTMCEVHGKKACPKEDDESAQNKEPKFTGQKDKEGKVVLITDKKQIQEKLTKKMSVGEIIKDVKNSEDPRFKGDSQEKRKERALAIWYKMHPEKSNKVEEGFLDQRSKKSTRSEEASKKMAADISKRKEKIFDSNLRKQEMIFSHKLKNGKKVVEQSAPADTSITFPATNSREGLKV